MMNNSYNVANLPSQHHVATAIGATPSTNYLSAPTTINYMQPHQHVQFAALRNPPTAAAGSLYDTRQLQTSAGSSIENSYFNAGTTSTNMSCANQTVNPARFLSSGNDNASGAGITNSHPILLANTFATQHLQQQHSLPNSHFNNGNSIRILSTTTPQVQDHEQQAQHIYNLNNNNISKDDAMNELQMQHMQMPGQQQIYSTQTPSISASHNSSQFLHQQFPSALISQHSTQNVQHFTGQHYVAPSLPISSVIAPHQQQPFYISHTTDAVTTTTNISTDSITSAENIPTHQTVSEDPVATAVASTTSTVVLDRINICINNPYNDSASSSSGDNSINPVTGSALHMISSAPPQQASPIIPTIQHKAIIDVSSLLDPYSSNSSGNNGNDIDTVVIDEPDSTTTTTTPQTPPTTPENNSPKSTGSSQEMSPISLARKNFYFDDVTPQASSSSADGSDNNLGKEVTESGGTSKNDCRVIASSILKLSDFEVNTITEPVASPKSSQPAVSIQNINTIQNHFEIGEEVFTKQHDGRLYLGTVVRVDNKTQEDGSQSKQYVVRFDDKTEVCCDVNDMKKMGGPTNTVKMEDCTGPMCVACKRRQRDEVVEICERCSRGYHRHCTTETSPGSGQWLCKRCGKSMKVAKNADNLKADPCLLFPYDVDSLNWDEMHRVNEEQIYCYCGKTGKFDDNMLQCCKCRNWFHILCVDCMEEKDILRGDGFFVFCCTVCNEGVEFLRRLQINWVDLLHLTLYNLSAMKKHQNFKYSHLIRDILPFVLQVHRNLPMVKEWGKMSENDLLEKIKTTLEGNKDRFICGREIKRDHYMYGLRKKGPPVLPVFNVNATDVLCDAFLTENCNLTLYKESNVVLSQKSQKVKPDSDTADPYEFCTDDDGKFTSDDEIPIKHMMNKDGWSKRCRVDSPNSVKVDLNCEEDSELKSVACSKIEESESSNIKINLGIQSEKIESISTEEERVTCQSSCLFQKSTTTQVKSLVSPEKISRRRKVFKLRTIAMDTATKSCESLFPRRRNCDPSSDDNSSSSGSTLIKSIPTPENFLGSNNPFRIISPKKPQVTNLTNVSFKGQQSGKFFKSNMLSAATLDLSSKIAELKSTGIYLSKGNIGKAAGQPRTVRTVKRRLSAKDITIGPNQEVRRRRTRAPSSNVEVISTTTINPFPSNFFALHAKDSSTLSSSPHTSTSSSPPATASMLNEQSIFGNGEALQCELDEKKQISHGRSLRKRPSKVSPSSSRRDSVSSTLSNQSNAAAHGLPWSTPKSYSLDIKNTVSLYFGAKHRIESGEKFCIRGKRKLDSGEEQYLILWGMDDDDLPTKYKQIKNFENSTESLQGLNMKQEFLSDTVTASTVTDSNEAVVFTGSVHSKYNDTTPSELKENNSNTPVINSNGTGQIAGVDKANVAAVANEKLETSTTAVETTKEHQQSKSILKQGISTSEADSAYAANVDL